MLSDELYLRWLCGHLDTILKDADWKLGAGVAGDPEPEVHMDCGWAQILTDLVQGRHP